MKASSSQKQENSEPAESDDLSANKAEQMNPAPDSETPVHPSPVYQAQSPPGQLSEHSDAQIHLPPTDPVIGKTLSNEYQILELIGTGGWSRVYKAKRNSADDYVAIKVLHSHLLFDHESVSRFEREARSQAGLSHPNICRVFDYNRLDTGQPYIVMEYLEGESLSAILRREGKLDPAEAVHIFAECCRGLKTAHEQGIVHRDVKPANIFLIETAEGKQIKLLDFGMAKIIVGSHPDLTQTGTAFGTVQYMSPEQALGDPVDGRSDLYALGCVMYESLTGKKVFEGRTAFGVMEQHVRKAPKKFKDADPNSAVPAALETAVLKALAKSADNRFQTAGELIDTLEGLNMSSNKPALAAATPQHLWWIVALSLLAALALSFSAR